MDSNTQSQAQSLQEEIRKLKEQLNVLNADKEALFSKKEEVSRKIRALISEVVASKKERNALTDSVKVVKELRTKLNSEISTKLKAVGEIKKTAPAPGSYSMRGDSAEFIRFPLILRRNLLSYLIQDLCACGRWCRDAGGEGA